MTQSMPQEKETEFLSAEPPKPVNPELPEKKGTDFQPAEPPKPVNPELPKQGKPSIFSWAALSEVFNFSKKPSSQVNGIVTPGGKKHKGRSRAKKNKSKKNKTKKNKKTAKKQ